MVVKCELNFNTILPKSHPPQGRVSTKASSNSPEIDTCTGDIVINGIIDVADVMMMLSQYGCDENCEADITGDGAVSANDVLAIIALFGLPC